jgi:hypothetical protein
LLILRLSVCSGICFGLGTTALVVVADLLGGDIICSEEIS